MTGAKMGVADYISHPFQHAKKTSDFAEIFRFAKTELISEIATTKKSKFSDFCTSI